MQDAHTEADMTTVNIVMRTRNRVPLLRRAVEDVLTQSFEAWHLTIVNDGGDPAAVEEVVDSCRKRLGARVTTIHHSDSAGMEAAANAGVRSRPSRFVAIHDDDDTWHPDFLRRTTGWLDAETDSPAVGVRTEIVWERMSGDAVVEIGRDIFLPERRQITLLDLLRFNSSVPISMLYRRSELIAVGLFDETLRVTGDWEANMRLAVRGVIGFLDGDPLAYWHQRPGLHGELGNSVIALRDEHADYDRLVRDRELRAYAREDGLGLPLYLTRLLDERFDELRRTLEEAVARREADRLVNVLRRLRARLTRSRRPR